MSNPNGNGYQNPWQSQQPSDGHDSQPVNTTKMPQQGQQTPLGQQFDQNQNQQHQYNQHQGQQQYDQQQYQGQQQFDQHRSNAVMPYQQQQMTHPGMQNAMPYGAMNRGPLGKVRNNWGCIGLSLITLGFYSLYWTYSTFNEMKEHRGAGTGGGLALVIDIIFSPAILFMAPSEVSHLYTGAGRPSPVSGATGFWILLPIFGPLIWFLKVNGALNDYWTSMGAGNNAQIAPQQNQQYPAGA